MSKWLPYENLVYKTKITPEQVVAKLNENIEAEKSFGLGSYATTYSKPYIGYVVGDQFRIKRATSYMNSFLPEIKGEILSDYDGTRIRVIMKPVSFVLIFMAIWFSGVTLAAFAAVADSVSKGFNGFLLLPFGMLIFGVALIYGLFKPESAKSKKDLERIMEAEIMK